VIYCALALQVSEDGFQTPYSLGNLTDKFQGQLHWAPQCLQISKSSVLEIFPLEEPWFSLSYEPNYGRNDCVLLQQVMQYFMAML
jgi:hypothetical protein